jgi:pyruvate formate lyase activating enzyme
VKAGKLTGGRPHEGNVSYYYDPLPTNCVADFVCAGGQGCDLPQYAVSRGPEYGHKNLAVFYQACSFNCLFCQNYHYKERTRFPQKTSAEQVAAVADEKTTCICYFGGDPSPQIHHALRVSRIATERAAGRVLRICWETNGAMKLPFLKKAARLSLESGGCIKFDLKAWNDSIHHALCGVSNENTLGNFKWLSEWIPQRPVPPFLIASTLLVPGYVDVREVAGIAGFLASLNRDIPYRLLAFYPQFYLTDLPTTSRPHAFRCKAAAEQAGLRRVSLGNAHLLGTDYG